MTFEIHATHITLNELLDHARYIFDPPHNEWEGFKESVEYIWRNFESDAFIQDSVAACIMNREQLLTDEGEEDKLSLSEVDTSIQSVILGYMQTYATSLTDSDVLAISTFAETLHDFVLEYLDLKNWLGDLSFIERIGERFSFYFG